jgi:hypothetical protein
MPMIEYTELYGKFYQLPYNYNNKNHQRYTFHSIDHSGVMKRITVEVWAASLQDAARMFCHMHGVHTCVAWHERNGKRVQECLKSVRTDSVTWRYVTPRQIESQWREGATFQAERDLFVALELAIPHD